MMSRQRPLRTLVTGGTGFLGRHLVPLLLREGCLVAVASNSPQAETPGLPVEDYLCDMRDSDSLSHIIKQTSPQVVFHLAGLARGDDLAELLSVNVLGTKTLLDALRPLTEPPVVIIPGSAAEYGFPVDLRPVDESAALRPVSSYGVSKAAQSLLGQGYALRGNVPVIIGRVFNILGPGEPASMLCGAIAAQVAACEAGHQPPVVRVGNLAPVRDYVDVRDAARALWLLALEGVPGAIYNICSGQPRRVEDVVRQLLALSSEEISLWPDPERQRPSDIPHCVGNPDRLHSATGWISQFSLEESLQATLTWWRDNHARIAALAD